MLTDCERIVFDEIRRCGRATGLAQLVGELPISYRYAIVVINRLVRQGLVKKSISARGSRMTIELNTRPVDKNDRLTVDG